MMGKFRFLIKFPQERPYRCERSWLGKHKLDGKENEIGELPSFRVSKSATAWKFKVSRICLVDFIEKRGIQSIL
jgi:hypothetical protein